MTSNSILQTGEEIGFQIKEGPCNAGCEYCYERSTVLKLLEVAKKQGKIKVVDKLMSNFQLASFINKNKGQLNLEMSLSEIKKYFRLLSKSGVKDSFLIGSEPCLRSRFEDILNLAKKFGINLTVYTSGNALRKLKHPAVKTIILHLSRTPNETYMITVVDLLKNGKNIELRINFSGPSMREKAIIFGFYSNLNKAERKKVLLKYSFSSKVSGNLDPLFYVTPQSLHEIAPVLIELIDEVKKNYPEVSLKAERPLFRCAFPPTVWKKYEQEGGFRSLCNMDFTVYIKKGLAFCPPGRDFEEGKQVNTANQLKTRINSLRKRLYKLKFEPSFKTCKKCRYRLDELCQGGCAGYKIR
jgi:sulfatase maturation enzyme AslB (radical SAM superfamily)